MYRFERIRMDLSDEAFAHNDRILGPNTVGFEVTQKMFARKCRLNIDPQHPDNPDEAHSSCAEECLKIAPPPSGTICVTIREDADAITGMAVMQLKFLGQKFDDLLVHWVGLRDLYGSQRAEELYPEVANMIRDPKLITAMNAIAFAIGVPDWPNLTSKVEAFERILQGKVSERELEYMISKRKPFPRRDFVFEKHGPIGFIEAPGCYIPARQAGVRRYPVTVISDPEFETHEGLCKRLSLICQHGVAFDLKGCKDALNDELAHGWRMRRDQLEESGLEMGGNSRIISTPQGVGRDPRISDDRFVEIARQFCK